MRRLKIGHVEAAIGDGNPCSLKQLIVRRRIQLTIKKSLIVEGKREKKKVERLTMQVSSLQKEPFTITPGKGQKLCEIERIQYFLSKKKTDELRNLHKLLYNRPGTPLPKSKKTPNKGGKKERSSSGTARKVKRTKCPEILTDESSSEDDEKKGKDESSEEDKESEEEQPKKSTKKEKPKQKVGSKKSESENSSDDEPLIKKLKKPPTDEELKETVKKLLADANLEEVTMKQICKEVYKNYPSYDLSDRKEFIKKAVKEVTT
uniref:Protein DEK n=1 Tax=Naja naja TaxID=35670 RepID=A0A8C6XVV5_NAJNA